MSTLLSQHIIELKDNKRIKLKALPFSFAWQLKDIIHETLKSSDFKASFILENLKNLTDLTKKDLTEISGFLDIIKDIFFALDTNPKLQEKITAALENSTLITFDIDETKDGKKIETNVIEKEFNIDKMIEYNLQKDYYPIILSILKAYYLPFIPTLTMK